MRQIFLTSMVVLLLTGCSNKQVLPTPVGELKALDNFWKLIGGDKNEEVKETQKE